MSNKNPNCCGGECRSSEGQVRVYPLGGGANLILCRACWVYENSYRLQRGDFAKWPPVEWSTAEVYGP